MYNANTLVLCLIDISKYMDKWIQLKGYNRLTPECTESTT